MQYEVNLNAAKAVQSQHVHIQRKSTVHTKLTCTYTVWSQLVHCTGSTKSTCPLHRQYKTCTHTASTCAVHIKSTYTHEVNLYTAHGVQSQHVHIQYEVYLCNAQTTNMVIDRYVTPHPHFHPHSYSFQIKRVKIYIHYRSVSTLDPSQTVSCMIWTSAKDKAGRQSIVLFCFLAVLGKILYASVSLQF